MTKRMTHFEAVQVVERLEDGRLKAWWPAAYDDKRLTEREAKADAVRLAKENPGVEYQVIRVEVTEMGAAKTKRTKSETIRRFLEGKPV